MIASRVLGMCPDVRVLRGLFVIMLVLKSLVLFYASVYGLAVFGEGNDADYYHKYASGEVTLLANSWAAFLKWLNDIGCYSREGMRFFMGTLGAVAVPFLAAAIAVRDKRTHPKDYWCVVLMVSLYPTLFYYALDIYRDVLMCCLFLLVLFFLQVFYGARLALRKIAVLAVLLSICGVLFLMRPYLGVSLLLSLIVMFLFGVRSLSLWVLGCCYIILLNALYAAGLLDSLMLYRSKFGVALRGGSNLEIVFDSSYWFVPTFLKSVLVQLFGFYFQGFLATLLFVVESVPLIAGLVYTCRNWRFVDQLSKFLCVFFVIYGTIWLLGNDNMGTAVRLRIFNYIAVLLCVVSIYVRKKTISNL